MNRQADTDVLDRPAAETAGKAERGLRKGFILGAAAGILTPVAAAAGAAATMGTDAALGVAYWWFWATPDEVPVLTALRICTCVGAIMCSLTCPKRPRAAFWWGATAGTCAPWLGGLAGRTVLELATGLADELASFL